MFRVPNSCRLRSGPIGSDDTIGCNGAFLVPFQSYQLKCMASDGLGWEHVSVSLLGNERTPSWLAMCFVKELFWDEEDCVIQFHPAKSQYVNFHPGCLHLWRKIGFDQPTPIPEMVGPQP